MEEQEMSRLFAAAAPEHVPPVPDLHHRARAVGRRQRRNRNVLTAGGTGMALAGITAAVMALGNAGQASGSPAAGAAGGSQAAPSSGGSHPAMPSAPSSAPGDDSPQAQAAVRALKAALPTGTKVSKAVPWRNKEGAFGIDVDAVSPANAAFSLVVSVAPLTGSGDSQCPATDHECGTIKLLGRDFHWRQPGTSGAGNSMNTIDIHLSDPTAHLILTFGTASPDRPALKPAECFSVTTDEPFVKAMETAFAARS